MDIIDIAYSAKSAYIKTMNLKREVKDAALLNIAKKITEKKDLIMEANELDLKNAKSLLDSGKINLPTYNRLKLNDDKIRDLIKGLKDLATLDDPINKIIFKRQLDENLILEKVTTPIGVIGVIFEARPDCFIQIASLIIKSGNCGILKGGSEAIETNKVFADIVDEALSEISEFPKNTINLIETREDIKKMLELDNYIDLIIPRGSNKLVQYIKENTKIPVLGHSSGICHIFLDKDYDYNCALKIIIDAKTQYPSACNAVETLLIHKDFKDIEKLLKDLAQAGIKIIKQPESYDIEYGDKILAIKIVNDIDCAIEHINKYGSHHSDSILSDNNQNKEKFLNLVDSACVFSNCSTRFSDGFRFGFGAEVGISTNKTHARGPVGLDGLTIYKYKLKGNNDTVAPYANGEKTFKHKDL